MPRSSAYTPPFLRRDRFRKKTLFSLSDLKTVSPVPFLNEDLQPRFGSSARETAWSHLKGINTG
jgi:hypothetical protein